MLDIQRSSSTVKVYAVDIAAFHAPFAGQSVGRDSAVVLVQFNLGTCLPYRPPVLTVAIHEPQSTPIKDRPADSTGIGQASRIPAGPIHQSGLPGIRA